jgi:uncharacterized protein YraI
MRNLVRAGALAMTLVIPAAAFAQDLTVTAAVDLNMRAGPDPQYPIVGLIPAGQEVTLYGCIDDRSWCDVGFGANRGWSYSAYLVFDASVPEPVVVLNPPPEIVVPAIQYDPNAYFDAYYADQPFYAERDNIVGGVAAGAAGGAIIGALIAGPIGAAIGAGIGAGVGGAVDASLPPPEAVVVYVTSQPVNPVYLSGEVVIGAIVPVEVQLYPTPDYAYPSAYINGRWVLVDPETRAIVYVFV